MRGLVVELLTMMLVVVIVVLLEGQGRWEDFEESGEERRYGGLRRFSGF